MTTVSEMADLLESIARKLRAEYPSDQECALSPMGGRIGVPEGALWVDGYGTVVVG